MNDQVPLVATVSEVRDVVETFRRYAVLEAGWERLVESAAERLDSAPGDQRGDVLSHELAQRLRRLLAVGAWEDRALVDGVAADATELVRRAWPEGLPRPEDDDWSFPGASCA